MLLCCLTCALFYLFLMGSLLDAVVRVVEIVVKFGTNYEIRSVGTNLMDMGA